MNAIFFCAIIGLILPMGNLAASLADFTKQLHLSSLNATIRNQFVFPKDVTSDIRTRIIGGVEVTPHSYPFQAALLIYKGKDPVLFCGGTLIKPQWILTAAHCVDKNTDYVFTFLGAHDITNLPESINIQNATHFAVHEGWDEDRLVNDVALIKLPEEAPLTKNIATVNYTQGNDTYFNETGTIVGWGKTETTVSVTNVLRSVNSTIMSNEECAKIDPFGQVLLDSHICVSGAGIVGSCSGDSGGPLLVDGVQVGIVSFGYKDCLAGKPSVFTRITEFHDWIDLQFASDTTSSSSSSSSSTEATIESTTPSGAESYSKFQFSVAVSIMFTLLVNLVSHV